MGIDFREALDLSCSEDDRLRMEFAKLPLTAPPSPAPFSLTWAARKFGMSTRLLELAGEVNSSMPAYYLDLIADALNAAGKPLKGSKVLMVGIAADAENGSEAASDSPGAELCRLLRQKGTDVSCRDSEFKKAFGSPVDGLSNEAMIEELVSAQDAVVIAATADSDWHRVLRNAQLLIDFSQADRSR